MNGLAARRFAVGVLAIALAGACGGADPDRASVSEDADGPEVAADATTSTTAAMECEPTSAPDDSSSGARSTSVATFPAHPGIERWGIDFGGGEVFVPETFQVDGVYSATGPDGDIEGGYQIGGTLPDAPDDVRAQIVRAYDVAPVTVEFDARTSTCSWSYDTENFRASYSLWAEGDGSVLIVGTLPRNLILMD